MSYYARYLAVAVITLFSGGALASGSAGIFYADFGDMDGFGLEGDVRLGESFRLFGDVALLDDAAGELDIVRLGGAYVITLNEALSLDFGGSYQDWDGVLDDQAFGLHGGLRYAFTPSFTVSASLEYLMFDERDDDDIVLGLRGTFDLNPEFSLFAGLEMYTNDDIIDENLLKIGARFNF